MSNYIIFGAGQIGSKALAYLGEENVRFFIDNNPDKWAKVFCGKRIYSVEEALPMIKNTLVVIAVSERFLEEVSRQIKSAGVLNYKKFEDLKFEITRKKINERIDYIALYKRAISWIDKNTVEGKGIITTTDVVLPYPEVSGYYIPTLLRWGYREKALQYAKWLCSIQHPDGSWYDTADDKPYVFDSGQILKGLLAIRPYLPSVDSYIEKGCDWILSNVLPSGQLKSPINDAWGDGKTFSELIHTYCISPITEVGNIMNKPEYIDKAIKIADYYTTECINQIMNFDLLSHFYAYVMEAMVDIGREDIASEAMKKLEDVLNEKGFIPAYNNVNWVCSTGLFQLSLVWYKLGNIKCGDKVFEYACKLQNESGGWFGGYSTEASSEESVTYFPYTEISWAVKYFLDALYYRNLAQFESQADSFCDNIDKNDDRYKCVKNEIFEKDANGKKKVLDIGCGKGRYIKNLIEDCPNCEFYAVDLSLNVMEFFDVEVNEKKQGSLTNIPYDDNFFDVVYTCEALEHAVDIDTAVKELCRVVKPGGKVVIVDKNRERLGMFEIGNWEQWFDEDDLSKKLKRYSREVIVKNDIAYESKEADGLFCCFVATIK